MSTMQIFYTRLFQALEAHDPILECLAQLTRTGPAQIMGDLKSDWPWVEWGADRREAGRGSCRSGRAIQADRARFLELRTALPDPNALAEAQTILVRCGAINYGVYPLLSRYQMARAALERLALRHRSAFEALLEEQISPVREMFAAIGGSPPEIFNSRSPAVRE
jgi:hypothetical protein